MSVFNGLAHESELYSLFSVALLSSEVMIIITNVTIKIPSIPKPIVGKDSKKLETSKTDASFPNILSTPFPIVINIFIIVFSYTIRWLSRLKISPPAITEAICPETFTPIACISRKF